jgi:HEAT repeat protein
MPATCTDEDEIRLQNEIDVLVGEPGRAADEAEDLIVARGKSAIAVLETAIYNSGESSRRRVVQTLVRIGDPEVVPILRHLARADAAQSVREAAMAGLESLGHPR